MPITFREGSSVNLDLQLEEITNPNTTPPTTAPYVIGNRRVVVVIVDTSGTSRKLYQSDVDTTRLAVEPGGQTGLVRLYPAYDTFRASWSPYKVFAWVFDAAGWKKSFPAAGNFEVDVISSYGTYDI